MLKKRLNKMNIVRLTIIVMLFCALHPGSSRADVTDSAPGGFTIKISVNIHAAPAEVYNKFLKNIGDWWSPDHTFSGDSHNLSIEERPLGCFCEKLPNQGAVRHMEVIFLQPGKLIRMSGALGPLQALAVSAVGTFTLSPTPEGTKLDLTYVVGGYSPQGLNGIAPIADNVLTQQLTRLKNYVETGNPAGSAKK
ncbi:MAG: ATPase [Blastocatellia bacterium AA13]|nr:MAG: ATPase [Blastocatellia bacterium AA13]